LSWAKARCLALAQAATLGENMKHFQADAIRRINAHAKQAKEKILSLERTDWDYAQVYFNVMMCKTETTETHSMSIKQSLDSCV
jgi:hypothetical protein